MTLYERKALIALSVISIFLLIANTYFYVKHQAHLSIIQSPAPSMK